MSLRPTGLITIGDFEVPFLPELEIDSSVLSLTDTAVISIPNNAALSGLKFTDIIKKGDTVTISLGYEPQASIVFEGYVSRINPAKLAEIECEDEGYHIKRLTVSEKIKLKNTTVSELIGAIAPSVETNILKDVKIGDWTILENASVAKVMDKLKNDFAIYPFFRHGVLTILAGIKESDLAGEQIEVDFQNNVPVDESDIELENTETDNMVIFGGMSKKDGAATKVYAYYDGAVISTSASKPEGVVVGEIKLGENDQIDETTLEDSCVRKLESISYEGLGGSVVTYGYPKILHGDELNISDVENPDIEGLYKCVRNVTSFTHSGGLRQTLSIGIKL